jgi:hypothetical protein
VKGGTESPLCRGVDRGSSPRGERGTDRADGPNDLTKGPSTPRVLPVARDAAGLTSRAGIQGSSFWSSPHGAKGRQRLTMVSLTKVGGTQQGIRCPLKYHAATQSPRAEDLRVRALPASTGPLVWAPGTSGTLSEWSLTVSDGGSGNAPETPS